MSKFKLHGESISSWILTVAVLAMVGHYTQFNGIVFYLFTAIAILATIATIANGFKKKNKLQNSFKALHLNVSNSKAIMFELVASAWCLLSFANLDNIVYGVLSGLFIIYTIALVTSGVKKQKSLS